MKSQILTKSTAQLAQDVMDKDFKTLDKNIGEIINAQPTRTYQRDGVYGSSGKDNGKDSEKV